MEEKVPNKVITKETKIELLFLLHISMSLIFMHCQCKNFYIIKLIRNHPEYD